MAKVNQCDLRCPLTVLRGTQYEIGKDLPEDQKALLASGVGVLGVKQMVRAWFVCPQRNAQEEGWTPSGDCAQRTREVLDRVQLTPEEVAVKITDYQFDILRPYLGPPPEEGMSPTA